MNQIKKLLNKKSKTIASGAIVIGIASCASRLLGMFRDRILAGQFGAGDILDIYYAAFRIPDLVFNLLILGALSAGFIPVFTYYLKKKEGKNSEAWKLANSILNITALGTIIICLILFAFSSLIVPLVVPGFKGEKLKATIVLTRIMLLSPIFLGLSNIISGILNSFKRFFVYSLAPIMYNIGIIIGAVFFVKWWGISGLALGVVLGAFLHLAIQIPTAVHLGYRWQATLDFLHPGIRQIGRLMIPRTLSLATSQINFLAITIIASTLTAGSLSVFNFANNLQSFPLGIFGISFAIAAFPALSEFAIEKKTKEFVRNLSETIRQILFLIIPSSVLLFVLRAQIVRVILGTGNFDWQDTVLTLECLGVFALSLFAQALIPLLSRAFFSYEDSKTPFLISLCSVIFNITTALILVKILGIVGLVLAFSISSILNMSLLAIFLRRKIGSVDEKRIILTAFKIGIASVLAGISCYNMLYLIAPLVNMQTGFGVLIQGVTAGLVGIGAYLFFSWLLKIKELSVFWNILKTRLPWKKISVTEIVNNK